MRVTSSMLIGTALTNIQNNLEKLETYESQLTSGKRLSRPSDDPSGVGKALSLRASVATGEQHVRNMDAALDWLNATDVSLGAATSILQRARELAVQGSNDTLDAQQRSSLATEVQQLLEQMVAQGNSTFGGQRIFAGLLTSANPFTLGGSSVTYSGDSGAMLREIDVGTTLQVNVIGSTAFGGAFTALIGLRDHLLANDGANIASVDLPALDSAMSEILNVRANVGASINRLESSRDRQQLIQVRLSDLLSKTEDTDFTEAITKFTNQQTVLQSALAAGARTVQSSLLDYLR